MTKNVTVDLSQLIRACKSCADQGRRMGYARTNVIVLDDGCISLHEWVEREIHRWAEECNTAKSAPDLHRVLGRTAAALQAYVSSTGAEVLHVSIDGEKPVTLAEILDEANAALGKVGETE